MPGSAFEYQFIDDKLRSLYVSEIRLQKEIGVRKVLGAPVFGIIITIIPFAVTIGSLLLLTILQIVAQTIKTVLVNPAKSLRTE